MIKHSLYYLAITRHAKDSFDNVVNGGWINNTSRKITQIIDRIWGWIRKIK